MGFWSRRGGLASAAWILALEGCGNPQSRVTEVERPPCGVEDRTAIVAVDGVYQYGSPSYALQGTISFAQQPESVSVTEVTYSNAEHRSLVGEAALAGNRLDIELVPANGDTNYRADVSFLFDPETSDFCVLAFSDTNGDYGGAGSYYGEKP